MKHTENSKFLSLVLRHKPDAAGITLDKNGWANVVDLLSSLEFQKRKINMTILEEIVSEDQQYSKGRYKFNDDKTKIRANQGHSIKTIDVEMKEKVPPTILYHGTSVKSAELIMSSGAIKPITRNFVHLSSDYDTAVTVGKRHGKVAVLVIRTEEMIKDGYKFYISDNGVWQIKEVPKKYISYYRKPTENSN